MDVNSLKTFLFQASKKQNNCLNKYNLEISQIATIVDNTINTADDQNDIPVFSVVKDHDEKTYAVYNPEISEELEQNNILLQARRIHAYEPADLLFK